MVSCTRSYGRVAQRLSVSSDAMRDVSYNISYAISMRLNLKRCQLYKIVSWLSVCVFCFLQNSFGLYFKQIAHIASLWALLSTQHVTFSATPCTTPHNASRSASLFNRLMPRNQHGFALCPSCVVHFFTSFVPCRQSLTTCVHWWRLAPFRMPFTTCVHWWRLVSIKQPFT